MHSSLFLWWYNKWCDYVHLQGMDGHWTASPSIKMAQWVHHPSTSKHHQSVQQLLLRNREEHQRHAWCWNKYTDDTSQTTLFIILNISFCFGSAGKVQTKRIKMNPRQQQSGQCLMTRVHSSGMHVQNGDFMLHLSESERDVPLLTRKQARMAHQRNDK